jgi:protein-L-isoaspartate(D-aspartate) O-methyltransferase
MSDYAARRTIMVDTQVRPSDVTKFPIIDAMLSVPRELFVPRSLKESAYIGENCALGSGRVILEPRTLAKMLDALNIGPDELVLDVGSGLGYSAAVISCLSEAVVALEEDSGFATEAEDLLSEVGADSVFVQCGVLVAGAAQHGPYDVIILQGGVEQLPEVLLAQLKEGGRIAALFIEGPLGEVRIGYKIADKLNWRSAFNAGAPVLPGFEKSVAFLL